jgi:hypothetical protein
MGLNEVLEKKAENDSPYCFFLIGNSHMLFALNFSITLYVR